MAMQIGRLEMKPIDRFVTSETGYVFESRRISINKRGGDPTFGLRPSLSEMI